MVLLERMRKESGLTQRALSDAAKVDPSYISSAERRGLRLYEPQAQRIAAALGYEGDPFDLFKEVV